MKNSKGLFRAAVILIVMQILLFALFLYGCARVIRDASDELVTHSWRSLSESGAEVSLSFDSDTAEFTVSNGDVNCVLRGIYTASPDCITICDENSGDNYTFEYILHGDRIELSYNNSMIILEKA